MEAQSFNSRWWVNFTNYACINKRFGSHYPMEVSQISKLKEDKEQ